jgi:hypothetical protein
MKLEQMGRTKRFYFTATSLLFLLVILWAFSPSYFLHTWYQRPAPTPFITVHGALMTGWIVLLLVQSVLVQLRRVRWHKMLGYAGVIYAAVIVPIGCIAVTISAAHEVHARTSFMLPELNVLGLSLMQMLLFGSFVAVAALLRKRPDYHKRLMILATLCILPNPIVRLSFNVSALGFLRTNFDIISAWAALVVAVIAIDTVYLRRAHPAFVLGGLGSVAALYLTWIVTRGSIWNQFWINSLS